MRVRYDLSAPCGGEEGGKREEKGEGGAAGLDVSGWW